MPNHNDCPFCGILRGDEPGTIVARDDDKGFAMIKSIHPESVIHWLAMPVEHVESTEEFERDNEQRFVDLFEWAVVQAKKNVEKEPCLEKGFTLKTHFGSFETVPHAKIHILGVVLLHILLLAGIPLFLGPVAVSCAPGTSGIMP
jgi:histidine triad (HIT) family protein